MPQVLFTKVQLLETKRMKKGGGSAKFKAALTKAISKPMGWGAVAENDVMVKPGGSLMAKKMTLRNAEGDLATFEYVIDLTGLGAFEIHRVESEGTRGKSTSLWLHFTAKFVDIGGCGMLESYMVIVPAESKGTLTVEYQPESTQVDLSPAEVDAVNQPSLPGADVDNDPDDEDEDDEDEDEDSDEDDEDAD